MVETKVEKLILLRRIERKIPKIEGYSPEAARLLNQYRQQVLEVIRREIYA